MIQLYYNPNKEQKTLQRPQADSWTAT